MPQINSFRVVNLNLKQKQSLGILTALCLLLLTACEKGVRNMYNQPKYPPYSASTFFIDGQASRPVVNDTVPHASGNLAGTSSGRQGEFRIIYTTKTAFPTGVENRTPETEIPMTLTNKLLLRGQERYAIYCEPCHGLLGDGDGIVVRRGFPKPPTYHSKRLRNIADAHFYAVITDGFGIMYSYANRVLPDDRWAIVAYIRALQLSQNVNFETAPDSVRENLLSGKAQ